MKMSEFYLVTEENSSKEAVTISHKLMLKAGLVKRLASGLYSWLPLGLKVLRKVEIVIREEMNAIGALEILMPMVQPLDLWHQSKREQQYGLELLKFHDRHNNSFCLGPTHEEIVVDLIKNQLNSYKKLPVILYQLQSKFRDEIRPKHGVIRSREFLMKDAYSFHSSQESLQHTYDVIYQAYHKIFTRLGLKFQAVQADSGTIGGNKSYEFQILTKNGEDMIVYSDQSDYAANIEIASSKAELTVRAKMTATLQLVSTPNICISDELAKFLKVEVKQIVQSLVYIGQDGQLVLLLLRADDVLNELKATRLSCLGGKLNLADAKMIAEQFHCLSNFVGPVGFTGTIVADSNVINMTDFVCGANKDGCYFTGVNFGVNCKEPIIADLRSVKAGDCSPDGKGCLKIAQGIEVGHIFQLGHKYSQPLQAQFLDQEGKAQDLLMGCYGIGVSRVVAACIEQNHDEKGIIFPDNMAPFNCIICPIAYHKSDLVKEKSQNILQLLISNNYEVLLDDRKISVGKMMYDSELIGIPYRIVISEKLILKQELEFTVRSTGVCHIINIDQLIGFIKKPLIARG